MFFVVVVVVGGGEGDVLGGGEGEPESLAEGSTEMEMEKDSKSLTELCPQLAPLLPLFSGKGASRWHAMQQTSSRPVTAVHVWQTNVSFWNWS